MIRIACCGVLVLALGCAHSRVVTFDSRGAPIASCELTTVARVAEVDGPCGKMKHDRESGWLALAITGVVGWIKGGP